MVEPTPVPEVPDYNNSNIIQATYSQYFIFGSALFSLAWAGFNASQVSELVGFKQKSHPPFVAGHED